MFAIEYLVGKKYGMWLRGSERFVSHEDAMVRSKADVREEKKAEASVIRRRCVRIEG